MPTQSNYFVMNGLRVKIQCMYGPDAFCKLFAVIGNGLHACIRLACGHFLTHARNLDEIRASCPEQTNGLRLISRH